MSSRKATRPIWLMVFLAAGLSIAVLSFFLASVNSARKNLSLVEELRRATTQFNREQSAYLLEQHRHTTNALAWQPSDPDPANPYRAGKPSTELLERAMRTTSFAETAKEFERVCGDIERQSERADAWNAAVTANASHYSRQSAAFSSAATDLRQNLQRMQGVRRLEHARSIVSGRIGKAEPIDTSIESALIELLELVINVERIDQETSSDMVNNFAGNDMLPSVERLSDSIDDIGDTSDDIASLVSSMASLRRALMGDGNSGDPTSGLIDSIKTNALLARQRNDLDEDTSASLSKAHASVDAMLASVDQRTTLLRQSVIRSLTRTLSGSLVIVAVALSVLATTGVRLAGVVRERSETLERTISELIESRSQLVDIGELRRANAQIEDINRELTFQKVALDLACIYSETDAAGHITYVNDEFCRTTGYNQDELIGRDHRVVSSGGHPASFWADMYDTLARNGVWHGTICNKAKDGTPIWLRTTNIAFRDPQGNILRYASIRSDVTDRIRSEQAIKEIAEFAGATVDALAAHIAILDESGNILSVNRAWRQFCERNGGPDFALEGANYLEICDHAVGWEAAEATQVAEGIRRVIRGEQAEFSLEYDCHSPEEERWFGLHVTRFAGAGPTRVVVAHENITEARKAQEYLRVQAAHLRAHFGLKTPDALHLAAAQHHRCQALWTNDERLSKAGHGLAVNVLA